MSHWAYLLVWIDALTGRVRDVGVYSEETPTPTTIDRRHVYATLGRFQGATFAEAYEAAERYYNKQHALAKIVRLKPLPRGPATVIAIRGSR